MNSNLSLTQRLFLPSLSELIIMTTFTAMILADPVIKSFDVFWHLRTGNLLLQGIFPVTDLFSHTAFGKPWILHEWGSQVIFSLCYNAMGLPGLIVLKSLIFSLLYGLMFNLMLRKKINIFISLVFTLVLVLGTASTWTVRPHMFTNLLLVVLFWIYVVFKTGEKKNILWSLPFLFLVWINLHGGFAIGFVFLALCITADVLTGFFKTGNEKDLCMFRARQLTVWSLISAAACLINPNTYKGVLYPLMYIGNKMDTKMIQEWASPTLEADLNFFIVMAILILGLSFQKKSRDLHDIFLIMLFSFLTFSARRHQAVFSIVTTPVMAWVWQENLIFLFRRVEAVSKKNSSKWMKRVSEYLVSRSEWFGGMEKKLQHNITLFVVIAVITAISGIIPEKLGIELDNDRYPVEIVEYMKSEKIQGNLFNQYKWGGFIIWSLPDTKVFIDGRMDVYQRELSDHYTTIMQMKEGWEDLLDKYAIKHILVARKSIIARFLLQINDEWVLEKENDTAVFLSKNK